MQRSSRRLRNLTSIDGSLQLASWTYGRDPITGRKGCVVVSSRWQFPLHSRERDIRAQLGSNRCDLDRSPLRPSTPTEQHADSIGRSIHTLRSGPIHDHIVQLRFNHPERLAGLKRKRTRGLPSAQRYQQQPRLLCRTDFVSTSIALTTASRSERCAAAKACGWVETWREHWRAALRYRSEMIR